jgi:Flp pilus assembly protein TadG
MPMKSIFSRLSRIVRSFGSERRGNVATMFVFATLPAILFLGAGIDYGHAVSVRAALQGALDSTALMLSKTASTVTSNQLQTNAQTFFNGLFRRSDATNVSVTATYTAGSGSQVAVNGSASVPTNFMSILGYNSIAVTGSSTVKWAMSRLRVALVLDNTGSMADSGKMTALQTATRNLLSQLQTAASANGDVYVSITPFVKDVNLGSTNYSSSWIYWDDAAQSDTNSWDANNGTCSPSSASTRSTCTSQGTCSITGRTSQSSCTGAGTCSVSGQFSQSSCTSSGNCSVSGQFSQSSCTSSGSCSISGHTSQSSCTSAGSCSISGQSTQSSCQSAHVCSIPSHTTQTSCTSHGGTWNAGVWTTGVWTAGVWTPGVWTAGVWTPAIWTPASHSTWNGCVMDRGDTGGPDTGNYDTNVVAPTTSTTATLFPAEQYSSCPQAAMGLNYNWSTMTTLVNNMSPAGSTNQAIGLALGWMSLTGGGPFTAPAMDPNYTYTQVIILLTDGLNTQDRWYGNGSSTSTQVDARQTLTCANIKAAGITIYTIQVDTDNTPTSTLLQNCATDSSKFFLLTSANQIVTTFSSIGTSLSQLYIAR